jgi:hypothetical protein
MQIDDQITDEYDREFIALITDIEQRCRKLDKHDKLRIESWCKKLCQVTNNIEWKKNRNLHAISLLDMILNNRFEEPYNKFAPEGPIPVLSKTLVKSRLSTKFWKATQRIYDAVNNVNNVNYEEDMYQQPQNMMMPPQQVNENKFEREFENYPVNQQIRNPAVANGQQKLKSNKNKYFQNNNIINNNDYQGNNNNATNEELQNMKNLILKLQNDLAQKDNIIQNQKEEKLRLTKRVDELERMLSTFLAMDKGN